MAGHSKWANIKHKKGREDAKRGKIFTKIIKETTVAARMGGGDPDSNPRLRSAIAAAKNENMPKDTLERAIKRGTGELEGVNYEEISYEGYGPGGAAVIIQSLTDNKNRAIAEIRHIFSKHDGNIGANGCVSWMFDRKGLIVVSKADATEDQLMEITIDAGAEDVKDEGENYEILTAPEDFEAVKEAVEKASIPIILAEVAPIPQNVTSLQGTDAEKMMKLMDALDDCDDVQHVHTNADIPDDLMI
jgi:YebC/PmpR family DNA-binding regulatory protein